MEIDKNLVARRISDIRMNLGKNTREFGELFDPPASDSIVSRWESGKSLPNASRLAKIAQLGGTTVDELIAPPLETAIKQYVDEIMMFEIKQGDQKYKLLYDPSTKQELLNYLYKQNWNGLTIKDGVRYEIKTHLEKYLNEKNKLKPYMPHSNENAILYSCDQLRMIMRNIDLYFIDEKLDVTLYRSFLKNEEIRSNLSPELYHQIRISFENLLQKLKKLDDVT